MVAEAASVSRRPALAFVVVLGSLSAFGPISIDMYLPGLPAMAKGFDASASAAQLTLTACLVGLAVGQLLAGPLSDRLGRRPPLLLGIAAYSASSLLCALAPSVEVLTVLRLVQGLTGAAGIVISRAVVRDLYSGRAAASFFSVLMLVNGLAPILAPVIGGQLLKVTSWRGVFVTLAAIGAAMLLSTAAVLRETLPPERRTAHGLRQTLGRMGALGRDRVFMGYALAAGLAVGAMFCYIAGSPFVLEDIYGISPQLFSAVFAVNACGIVAASQLGRRLLRSVSPRALLYGGLAASAGGGVALLCAVAIGGLGVWSVLVPLFVVVSAVGIVMPNATALAMQDHPEMAGSASALVGMLQFVVGALLAPLVGVAGRETALPMALLMASLGVGGLAAMLRTYPSRSAHLDASG
ncbi:MAG TPA: Bcr/CflA family multidrug efflux MFS transporter [Thermoleophilaceae bacterium]|nr:Bcr/CflA family multidrug efflux MFS transporter [Thermoleophilaceae bacterium]